MMKGRRSPVLGIVGKKNITARMRGRVTKAVGRPRMKRKSNPIRIEQS
jgi:hypothetical protein